MYLFILLVGFTSCSDDDDEIETGEFFRITFDNTNFIADRLTNSDVFARVRRGPENLPLLVTQAFDRDLDMFINIEIENYRGARVYTLDDRMKCSALFTNGRLTYEAINATLNITSDDRTCIEGTLNFVGELGPNQIEFTNGTYKMDIDFIQVEY